MYTGFYVRKEVLIEQQMRGTIINWMECSKMISSKSYEISRNSEKTRYYFHRRNRKCAKIIDIAIPGDSRVYKKEKEKIEEYQLLKDD